MTMTNQRKRWTHLLSALVLAGALTACGSGAGTSTGIKQGTASGDDAQAKTVIHVGVQGKTGILPYARQTGMIAEQLEEQNIEIRWHEFASGPPHFEALAAGRLDFGSVGGTPVIAGQVGNVDFKAVAVVSDGKKGNAIVIPPNSSIQQLADLKGKKIGVAKGSSAYNFLYMAIDQAGLTDNDIDIIQLQPDEARPALDSGAIDAWSIWEPYATTAVFQSGASILASGEDLGIDAPSFLIARTDFINEQPEATVAFLKAYEQTRLYFLEHLYEVAEEIADAEKLELEIVTTVLENSDPILAPITPEFAASHQAQADFLFRTGGIGKQLHTADVLESKYVEQALKELEAE
ncbi:aliphatic sulfonate ABC transporter substrate-binding protein [Xylanibacillus composti]|uniref:Putative aliphatic sulfonates-binding protein n=1 Tax=Xylanibacillus composti TaxID=1572762 RepID=A0A8J4H6S4_9BACL|nr:aliphatic sulfonate ABC transporter substrate-binding protein [Xylanibacillus composti]MDT9726985.1 aliphatic sulfonate ABC transporter substrate-binding protein [Xylanibacillus composti]GIQ69543.1 putative aliphatic sulfonates-binding protein [Xylanibacillus composti]